MSNEHALAVFENYRIRRIYDDKSEMWYFSVVDIIAVLIQQPDFQAARNYWKVLKNRLNKEGSQSVTKCNRLKLPAADGKSYLTDVADPETLLRLIQSILSPKAEPFKRWLARVGKERIDEIENPELAMGRMQELYEKKGYPKEWIDKRLRGIAAPSRAGEHGGSPLQAAFAFIGVDSRFPSMPWSGAPNPLRSPGSRS